MSRSETNYDSNANLDFIRSRINADLQAGKNNGNLITRFPPEPNGYLHIGHAKAICLNFGVIEEFAKIARNAKCHLRMDDTNPAKEEADYINAIEKDVAWLGFSWGETNPNSKENITFFASDYFEKFYQFAIELIKVGKAYIDHQNAEEIKKNRGTPTESGINSPFRKRSIEENLALFEQMKNGDFKDGDCVLRAKIDMSAKNFNMRDPVMYRIMHQAHHRTGNAWKIYPMYDFAHPLSDAIEGITHSFCTLEFEHHRPLYDWFIENTSAKNLHKNSRPQQMEFSRLNLSHTVISKRKLNLLVQTGKVEGWDDPRMPTLAGFRRRGFTPISIKTFCKNLGITKYNSTTDIATLENTLRHELNKSCQRIMAVLNPLKIVIENFPADKTEWLPTVNNPESEEKTYRQVPFTRTIYIERDDFMENPPRKFFRLSPDKEVRLRGAFFIKCKKAVKNDAGEITELICTYDPETRGGKSNDGRKVKATLHWVSAEHSKKIAVNLYDRLFNVSAPESEKPDTESLDVSNDDYFLKFLNPDSVQRLQNCYAEPFLLENLKPEMHFQFERLGYFFTDPKVFNQEKPVFNRTVSLRDTWKKS